MKLGLTTLLQHRIVIVIAVSCLGVTGINRPSHAQQPVLRAEPYKIYYSHSRTNNLSDGVSPSQINRIQQQIDRNKEKIQSSVEQGQSLYKELQRMDNELKVGQHKLAFLQERLLRQENNIQQKEREIELITAEKENITQHVEKRLLSYYQRDKISLINTLFSASTLPELINLNEYFNAMFRYDQQILHTYNSKIDLLNGARREIEKGKKTLLGVILEAKKQEEALIAARQARKDLLARVQTEEKLYRHALDEMKIAANELAKRMNTLSVRVIHSKNLKTYRSKSDKKRPPTIKSGFSVQQGNLPPPATGKVITYFGTYADKFDTETTSGGINIETVDREEIKAIYSGTVVFIGEMTGYGNMVVIDHGQQYYSLVSGLESILVEKGDQVVTGQTLGIMGSGESTLLSRGVHLEIRYETQPEDPLLWLDVSKLTITNDRYLYH